MIIKAISLWEPWASLMRCEAKTIETRSWYTAYRGPLLICASMRWTRDQVRMAVSPEVLSVVGCCFGSTVKAPWLFGNAVCLVDLVDCRPTESFILDRRWSELHFGDFSPGRWGWVTTNRRVIKPFYVRGRQRLFNVEVPDELLGVA